MFESCHRPVFGWEGVHWSRSRSFEEQNSRRVSKVWCRIGALARFSFRQTF